MGWNSKAGRSEKGHTIVQLSVVDDLSSSVVLISPIASSLKGKVQARMVKCLEQLELIDLMQLLLQMKLEARSGF